MLFIHTSNQLERLSQQFSSIVNTPLKDVFTTEMVVVQNAGMARYLSMQLATIGGISANTEYLFPAEFMWRLLRLVSPDIPEKSQCTPDTLRFYIMQEFSLNAKDYPELAHYLTDEASSWELSGELAAMLDRILFYRSDWITQWEQNPDVESQNNWQARLWINCVFKRKLKHWLHLQTQFKDNIDTLDVKLKAGQLPERISFFSMSSLSPGYLELISLIAQKIDIHIYIINPCNDIYWGDIASEKSRAKQSIEKQATIETGNPLLASMGVQGRDFIDQLLNLSESNEYSQQNKIVPLDETHQNTLLSTIQNDIYTLNEPPALSQKGKKGGRCTLEDHINDNSIVFNACHTAMREVEVLHDQILDALESDNTLTPADIVVMMPDVENYAPYIESIFESATNENTKQSLPYSIADRDPLNVHQLIEALLKVLRLPETNYDVESVFEILDYEAVQASFYLDQSQVDQCRELAKASNIRWGISAKSRSKSDLPATDEHTWKYALDRVLFGYCMGETPSETDALFDQTDQTDEKLPLLAYNEIEGSDALMLSHLKHFTDTLFSINQWKDQKQPLTLWLDKITTFINQLFDLDSKSYNQDVSLILKSIDALRSLVEQTEFELEISFEIFYKNLQSALQNISGHEKFLGHGITFCSLVPMRSVPFKIIALMGMNDGEFPRQDKRHSFDLVAKEPRRGDRSRRDEDRYLFLESILAARSRLIISYIGQSIKDNSELPPSVLVSELLDNITRYSGQDSKELICKHPLQAFSPRYFNGEAGLFSYVRDYAQLNQKNETPSAWFINKPLEPLDDSFKAISLDELIHFYQSPARAFLKSRFDIKIYENEVTLAIREPFKLESFKEREIRNILIAAKTDHKEQIARAKGLLPYGEIGDNIFNREAAIIEQFQEEHPAQDASTTLAFSLSLGEFEVFGLIDKLTPEATNKKRVVRHLSSIYAGDLIELWITHLALNSQIKTSTEFASPEINFSLEPVNDALEQLQQLVNNYWKGQHFPLDFFPKTAYSLYKDSDKKTIKKNLKKAASAWNGNDLFAGEKDKFENWLLHRNVIIASQENMESDASEFIQLSQLLFGNLYSHLSQT